MNPIKHSRKDELLTARIAVPAAGATAESDVLDMGQTGGIDEAALVLEHEAMPALVAAKKLTLTAEASADGTTWAAVPGVTLVATGATGNGVPAAKAEFRIPYGTARYLRLKAVTDASAGDNTAAHAELTIRV